MTPLLMNRYLKFLESLSEETLSYLRRCFNRTDGMISFDEAVLLYFLAKITFAGCIVEIGCYRGRSTTFLGRGSMDGAKVAVYAVDPHKNFIGILGGVFKPSDRKIFYKAMLANNCSEIVSLINLSSEMITHLWKERVSLLWIDGDHSYDGVKLDFYCWLPHLMSDAVIAFDDAIDHNLGPKANR